jgi:hypothetical protein
MVQENEIITLILGVGTLLFVVFNRRPLRSVVHSRLLLSALIIAFWAWALTNVEGYIWFDFINCIEHVCYAVSSVLLAIWCLISLRGRGSTR